MLSSQGALGDTGAEGAAGNDGARVRNNTDKSFHIRKSKKYPRVTYMISFIYIYILGSTRTHWTYWICWSTW